MTVAVGTAPSRPRASPLKIAIFLGVIGIAGFFLVRYLAANWAQVREYPWQFHWGWFIGGFALVLTSLALTAEAWRHILARLGGGVPRYDAWTVWGLGQTVKYVPGMVWLVAVRMALTRRYGISMGLVAVSGAIEIAMLIATLILFSAIALPLAPGQWAMLDQPIVGDIPLRAGAWLVVAGGLIALHPRIFKPGLRHMLRVARANSDGGAFDSRQALLMVGWYLVIWTLNGLGMAWFCTAATVDLGAAQWLGLTSAYIISFTIGVLVIFLPMGLGVQEAAFAALTGDYFPNPAVAVVVCLATRFVLGAGEFVLIGLGAGLRALSGKNPP